MQDVLSLWLGNLLLMIFFSTYQMTYIVVGQVQMRQVETRVQVLDLFNSIVLQEQAFKLFQVTEK